MTGGHPALANILSGLSFAGFLVLGLLSARASGPARPRRVSAFLAYTLTVSLYAGLKQRDGWPFSSWPIVAVLPLPVATRLHIVAVDSAGQEHEVDYRAWQPLGYEELVPWLLLKLPRLEPGEKEHAASWLLDRAESARQRARAAGRPGYFDRFLGPFTAPYFFLHPRLWSDPAAVPARPLRGLRLYNESWPVARGRTSAEATRDLSYEYRRP